MKIKTDEFKAILNGFNGSEIIHLKDDFIISEIDGLTIAKELNSGFRASVYFSELFQLINKTKEKLLFISLNEGNIEIKGKKLKAGIKTIDTEIPDIDIPDEYTELPEGFQQAIKNALITVQKNADDLTGLIKIADSEIVSSDDLRISRIKFESGFTGVLKATHFKNISDFVSFSETESEIFFKTKSDTVFCLKKLDTEFMDVSEYFEFDGNEIELPEKVIDFISTSSIFTEGNDPYTMRIDIEIKENKIKVRGENDRGFAEIEDDFEFNGELSISANPKFISDAIEKSNKFKIAEDETKALVKFGNINLLMMLHSKE